MEKKPLTIASGGHGNGDATGHLDHNVPKIVHPPSTVSVGAERVGVVDASENKVDDTTTNNTVLCDRDNALVRARASRVKRLTRIFNLDGDVAASTQKDNFQPAVPGRVQIGGPKYQWSCRNSRARGDPLCLGGHDCNWDIIFSWDRFWYSTRACAASQRGYERSETSARM